MKTIELKSSLSYVWYQIVCFFIQIFSHLHNLSFVRLIDQLIDEQKRGHLFLICLILISLTIICTSLSSITHCFDGFGNSIEESSFEYSSKVIHVPYLTLFDVYLSILMMLPSLFLESLLIEHEIKDRISILETSIDWMFVDRFRSMKIESRSSFKITRRSLNSSWINYLLILVRFYFVYSNRIRSLAVVLSYSMTIYSSISIVHLVLMTGTFEIFFKQVYLIESTNLSRCLSSILLLVLMVATSSVLLSLSFLFRLMNSVRTRDELNRNKQLTRLSTLDLAQMSDNLIDKSSRRFILLQIFSIVSQTPLVFLSFRTIYLGLLDPLLIVYLSMVLVNLLVSILFVCSLTFCRWSSVESKLIENDDLSRSCRSEIDVRTVNERESDRSSKSSPRLSVVQLDESGPSRASIQ